MSTRGFGGRSRVFEAKYDGYCPACGEDIVRSDRVCFNTQDAVVHEECADSNVIDIVRISTSRDNVCSNCNTEHVGVCW